MKYFYRQLKIIGNADRRIKLFAGTYVAFGLFLLLVDLVTWFQLGKLPQLLLEAHFILFDILVFGVLLSIYEYYERKDKKVDHLFEELEDLREWYDNEAGHRVKVTYNKLLRNGQGYIDLSFLHIGKLGKQVILKIIRNTPVISVGSLEGAMLDDVDFTDELNKRPLNLQNSDLQNSTFTGSNLHYVELNDSFLLDTAFKNCTLNGVIFDNATLQIAKFNSSTNLAGCSFKGAFLPSAEFVDTNIVDSSFKGANLNKAKFISGTKLKNVDLRYTLLYETEFAEGSIIDIILVESTDWFDKIDEMEVIGRDWIKEHFDLDEKKRYDKDGSVLYLLKNKATLEPG